MKEKGEKKKKRKKRRRMMTRWKRGWKGYLGCRRWR